MTATPQSAMNPTLAFDACKTAPHGLVVLDDSVVDCNERFCRMIGAPREELIGTALLSLSPEVQSDGAFSGERWHRRWHAAQAGLPQWFPWQFRNRNGQRIHALVHLTRDSACGAALLAHVHDLSNLSEVGWIQRETQDRLRQVLDRTKAVIFVKDRAGRYVFANRELERVVRVPAENIVGHTDLELWPPDIAAHFQTNDAQVLSQGTGTEFEVTVDAGRERRTFLSFKFPLCSADGEPYGVCGIATDITETKRTQDALTKAALAVSSAQGASVLQELVRYLATILEVDGALIAGPHEDDGHMRVHAFVFDGEVQENYDYESANTPCGQVLGQSFRFYSSGLRDMFPEDVELARLGLESYAGFPLSDGSGKPIGLIAVLSRAPMSNAEFIESILKIFAVRAAAELERQRAEEILRRSEASYRAIFEASEDAIFIHDWDTGAVIDVNRRACEVTGYTYEEMKRISVAELSSGEHPYTGEEAAKRIEEAKAGNPVRFEWRRRRKNGSLHWDEVVLRSAVIAGERRVVAFTREITERKQAEQALRQAQKMEALGHLTGGIAHDFNNLLTSIMGYITLAADHPATGDAKLGKYLDQAGASCGRARDLIQQMLTFSRGQRGQPRPVSLQALVEQSVGLFGPSLPATIAIEKQLEAEVPAVMLDPVHLDQILLNLCLNARDAMNGRGTIRISIAAAARCGEVCTACRQHASGEFVELTVDDSGEGIAPEIIDRIFEPFFSTKEVGKGSGMGLASVHGIVHESGGHIVVDSTPGRGTRFRVLFPALADAADRSAGECETRACGPHAQLRGRVLVVDDELAVGTFMGDLLECWGLEVTVSTSPAEAAALFGEDARRFDLVITDQVMPRKTGVELARELLSIRPDLPVILYTGYNADARSGFEDVGLRAVVSKPVDPHALFGLLQTHLPRA